MEEPRRPFQGFTSVQPVLDQYEETTIVTTDVGLTYAGNDTEAASTTIWIPHSEFPHGVSVNVVSHEPTLFLIGLDVIREYGLVIDYHYNRVYSHIINRDRRGAILPTGPLEMMPSKSEWEHPASSTRRWGQQQRAQQNGTLALESPITLRPKHDHEHKSTSEDDWLQLLGMLEDTLTWTQLDKRGITCRTPVILGTVVGEILARITIDDRTGHARSLEHTKHMNEKHMCTETCPLFVTVTRCCFTAHL